MAINQLSFVMKQCDLKLVLDNFSCKSSTQNLPAICTVVYGVHGIYPIYKLIKLGVITIKSG